MATMVPVLNGTFTPELLENAPVYFIYSDTTLCALRNGIPEIDELFFSSYPALRGKKRHIDAMQSVSTLFDKRVADILSDQKQKLRCVFLINSLGGRWDTTIELTRLIREVRERGGDIVAFLGNTHSAASRLLACMDRVYAFDSSTIGFHDIGNYDDETGTIHYGPDVETLCSMYNEDHGELPSPEIFLPNKVVETKRDAMTQKLSSARQDERNKDSRVEFSPSELEGLITDAPVTCREMGDFFTRESGMKIDFTSMQSDFPALLLYLWERWNRFSKTIQRKCSGDLNKYISENERLTDRFTACIQKQHPWLKPSMIGRCINGVRTNTDEN